MTDMTAAQALDAVRDVMRRVYNNAAPVCCGRPGLGCCGEPVPEWSEHDEHIIITLQAVEEYLVQALAAPRVPVGWLVMRSKYGVTIQAPTGHFAEVHKPSGIFKDVDPVVYDLLATMLTAAPDVYAAPQPAERQPEPDASESKATTSKESWWAGYRAGKGLPANTPRQDAIAAPRVPDGETVTFWVVYDATTGRGCE